MALPGERLEKLVRSPWYKAWGTLLVSIGALLVMGSIGYYLYVRAVLSQVAKVEVTAEQMLQESSAVTPSGDREAATEAIGPQTTPSTTKELMVEGLRFRLVDPQSLPPPGTLPPATAVRIPAINLVSPVVPLRVVQGAGGREYQAPKFFVGHVPSSANPGERGRGWYFGHLQSPVLDEGEVFRFLPKVRELLQEGQRVYVLLESQTHLYLYRVTDYKIMHWRELNKYFETQFTSPRPEIVLVASYPPWVYTHRFLVFAQLLGVAEASE